jgi:signal transduction histidine kinase
MVISAVTIALFAILGTFAGRKAILDSVTRHLASVRANKGYQVQSYFRQKLAESQILAQKQALVDFESTGFSLGFRQQLRDTVSQLGFEDVLILDLNGAVRFSLKNDPNVIQLEPLKRAFDIGTRLPLGSARLSDFVLYSPAGGRPRAFVVTPIGQSGRRTGVLLAALSPDEINRIMTGGQNWRGDGLGETGESYLVGQDRLMRSDSRMFIENGRNVGYVAQLSPELQELGRQMQRIDSSILLQPVNTTAVDRALSLQESVIVQRGYNGKEVLSAFTTVNVPGITYVVISEMSLEEAYAPVSEFQQQIVVWAMSTICVVALLSFVISRRFVRPIVELTSATHDYGEGDISEKIPVRTRDEVGELTETFNRMIEQQEGMKTLGLRLRRNIVHDLKTPVTVIRGCAETLLDSPADPALQQELLGDIVGQSDRLLEDLRDIITPVSDDWTPQVEGFDLSLLVQKAITAEKHTGRAQSHQFAVIGTDSPILMNGDRRKIRRVIENLLSNAVKYSPGDGKTVTITVKQEGDRVRLEFADEGIGLSPADLEKVIREAGRVNEANLGIEGSGFGLDSCRHVLEAHGGELMASSTPGKGSVFTAIVPVHFAL